MEPTHYRLDERTLFDYWFVLYEQKRAILVVTAAAVLLAVGLSLLLPSIYEARAVFYVPPPTSQPLLERGVVVPFPSGAQEEARAYVKILRGNNIQHRIRQKFLHHELGKLLARNVDFSTSREGMITIYVKDRDPELATAVANAYVATFDEFNQENTQLQVSYSLAAVERHIDEFTAALNQAQTLRQAFREQHFIASLQTELDELVKQRQTFQRELETDRVALEGLTEQLRSSKDELTREAKLYVPTEMVVTSPAIESLQKTLAELGIQLAGKRALLSENHPAVVALRDEYSKAKKSLEDAISRIEQSRSKALNSTYEALRQKVVISSIEQKGFEARIAGLQGVIATLNQNISSMPEIIEEAHHLDQDVQRNAELLTEAMKQREQLRTQVLRGHRSAVVVETALPPVAPVFPNLMINIVMALLLGLLGGVIYAFFLDYIAGMRRIHKLQDITQQEFTGTSS